MPKKHWVLVAERRNKPASQRKREVIYVTTDKPRAEVDANLLAQQNKKMRFYIMKYDDAMKVAGSEIIELEKALIAARQMVKV